MTVIDELFLAFALYSAKIIRQTTPLVPHEISLLVVCTDQRRVLETMMHVETQFDLEKRVRLHKITGEVSLPEFHEALRQLYASPQFNPDMNALWDIRQADFTKVTPDDVRSLMQVVATHWGKDGKCRAAIVVAGMAEYGISRMYESQFGPAAPCKIKVFLDVELAWKWFGASDEVVKSMASRRLGS